MIKTLDNHRISYIEKRVGNSGVLLCHGISSSKDEGGFYIELANNLNSQGLSTLRFDFRGHGDSAISSYSATIAGMICDLHQVIGYMSENYKDITIVAASFGASILLLLMQKFNLPSITRIILLNPVTNFNNTFISLKSEWSKSFFPKGGLNGVLISTSPIRITVRHLMSPLMALELFYYHPENTAGEISIPTLILHGQKDKIVSIEDTRKFKDCNCNGIIKLKEYEIASHGLEEEKEDVFHMIASFVKE